MKKQYLKASEIKGQKLPYPAKQSEMVPLPESSLKLQRAGQVKR
jgi:hypothetical protein